MKKATFAAIFAATILIGNPCFGAPLRFEKVSDHCYYLQIKDGPENVFAVVTEEGILVVDPPPESDLPAVADALKRLSTKPVRWVAFSNPRSAGSAGARFFAEQRAMLLAGKQLRSCVSALPSGAPEGAFFWHLPVDYAPEEQGDALAQLDLLAGYQWTLSQPNEDGPAAGFDLSYSLEVVRTGIRVVQGFGDAKDARSVLASRPRRRSGRARADRTARGGPR